MDLLDQQLQANLRGDFEKGWALSQILEKERPYCNRAAFNRGWHYLQQGKFQEGFELLDRGRWEGVFGSPPLGTDKPIWNMEDDLTNKHLLLRAEGGLGDEMINVRFAEDFAEKGAKVTVGASSSLMSVFSRVEGVSAVVRRGNESHMYHDYWVPAMSAPRISGNTYETLSGEPYLTNSDRMCLSNDFTLGICWAGSPEFEHEQHRRFPPEKLIDIYKKFPEIQVCSFQKDTTLLDKVGEVMNLGKFLKDWETTLMLLSDMDLVISSCTSVAHASAALGIETWILVPILPYYIWALPGNKSPWYDSVTLYRQEKFGSWDETFEKLYADLEERIKK